MRRIATMMAGALLALGLASAARAQPDNTYNTLPHPGLSGLIVNDSCTGGERVSEPGVRGFEAEVIAEAVAVKEHVVGSRRFAGAAVGRRSPHRSKEGGEVGGFVVDHIVEAVRRRGCVEHKRYGSSNVGVVHDGDALRG